MPLLVPYVRGHCRVTPALPTGWGRPEPLSGTLSASSVPGAALCLLCVRADCTPPRSSVETSAVQPAPDPGLERALSVSVLSLLSL